jgi:hypothetical protein
MIIRWIRNLLSHQVLTQGLKNSRIQKPEQEEENHEDEVGGENVGGLVGLHFAQKGGKLEHRKRWRGGYVSEQTRTAAPRRPSARRPSIFKNIIQPQELLIPANQALG